MMLEFFNHPEGYVIPLPDNPDGTKNEKSVKSFTTDPGGGPGNITYSSYSYVFQYKDHLGNIRLSYADLDGDGSINPNEEIIEENNFFPFGLKHWGYNNMVSSNGNSLAQQWKFGGKQLDQSLGLETYDFGARNYNPDLGRWMNIDPLAHEREWLSPYNFVQNNPINRVDPTGALDDWVLCVGMGVDGDYYDTDGNHLGSDGIDDNKVYTADGKNEDGSFSNAQELSITHTEFQTISGIVKHEAGTSNTNENLWIAHTANNAANASGTSLYNKLMSGFSSVSNKTPLSTSTNSTRANSARAGVLNVFSGGSDPTGGSTLWDGTDFLAWGLNSPYRGKPHAKFRQYKNISISGDIYNRYLKATLSKYPKGRTRYRGKYYNIPASVFKDQSNWSNGGFYYNTGVDEPYGIKATGAFGRSIFWKK